MKPTTYFMEKYRYLCLYANYHQVPSLSVSLVQIQILRKIDSILFSFYVFIEKERLFGINKILNCLLFYIFHNVLFY